jgi:hypothetical protein
MNPVASKHYSFIYCTIRTNIGFQTDTKQYRLSPTDSQDLCWTTNLSIEEKRHLRAVVVDMILGTDMKQVKQGQL